MAVELSNDIWKNWDKSGRQEFIKYNVARLKDESSPLFDKNGKAAPVVTNINLLIEKAVKGVIKRESVVPVLHDLVKTHSIVASIICDVLNITDAITSQTDGEDAKDRNNFCYLVKECEKFLSDKLLKERLEIETLQEVGILKNKTFYSKFIKIKTKLYYKQRKFNLFREECEGFAKLQTELNKEFSDSTTHNELIDIVHSLIGCFNLDPNRVLDIILESFENKTRDARIFVPLISSYMNDPNIITEVLCTKLAFLKNNEDDIPKSFYILMAHLIQNSLININDIYSRLSPDDKLIQRDCEKAMRDAREYVRKLQIISINNKEKEDNQEEPEVIDDRYINNQKLGLCEALLLIGDWENVQTFIKILPNNFAVGYEPIAIALCNLLHSIIEPVYNEYCSLGPKIKRKSVPQHENPRAPKQATTFLELRDTAIPMLVTLGSSLHYDPVLLSKIVRLAKSALADCGINNSKATATAKNSLYYDIISILDHTILPSLSYLDCNCCLAEEIWTLVQLYPYQIRYCLYGRWKNETYSVYPELMKKRGDSEKQIKNIMKRVSKENIKPVGRLIGKLTHCSPGFLFDYVLLQIQVYNNLIAPVVDSLKYLTNLSYDVLGFCLVETLANADKKRVKHDSTSISTWLQSLSSFCGAVFKKHSIELTGLLQYVANQLKAQKSLDLLILKEVVQKMAGVDPVEDLTMDQLNAMSGGELLKGEAGYFSQVRNTKKSSLRLKEAMAENDLAVALCLLMAQQNFCVIYKETQKSHLKLVGKLSDQCQDTLVQFGTFLGSTMSVDEYVNKLPSIQSMLIDYHIPTEVAFFLARPMFNHAINQKYDQIRKSDPNYKKMSSSLKNQKYYEAVQEIMQPVHGSLLPLHSPKIWEDITSQFLATFWSLTMYDLFVPEDTYQQVINKAKAQSLSAMESSTSNKSKKEQERFMSLIEKLQDEKKKQTEHVEKVLYRLKQEKDNWFLSRSAKTAKTESITRFLQLCLFPRCTFTQIDAVYCAKFVHTIHILKTPNFSTLLCYDRIFCDVTYSIISCTENEAMRYGRFLYAMLETVMGWHKSKEVFEKECSNFPGFMTKYRVSNHTADNLDNVGYENYRHVCHKWHYKLAKAVVTCLESKDYVQIRNSLIILIKIIPFFPILVKLAQFIEKRIEKVRDEEKNNRQDLFTLSSSYLGQLKQRMTSGHMMKEGEFHIPVEKEKVNKGNQDQANVNSKDNSANKINGEAKETTPKEKSEKKLIRTVSEEPKLIIKNNISIVDVAPGGGTSNNKEKRDEKSVREESKERYTRKEEKRIDEYEKEREREKRRERKEEKLNVSKEERQERKQEYKEERYIEMVSPKDDYAVDGRQVDRFYEERPGHYYREARDEREPGGSNLGKHNPEPEPDRDVKRRKVDVSASKNPKHEERKTQIEYFVEKPDKKERSAKAKEKREKLTEEEKELKRERKLGRKRVGLVKTKDRLEESLQQDLKRRREEEKVAKLLSHQNGDMLEPQVPREKHHRREARELRESREISPYSGRERSHERSEPREKHRRSSENKRR
ncbi:THO complex subunit 2 isoform X2 [Cylas formicarius]|uniref:THO complex subunit 2 isoform X2 n=1 Tax=Cylas formicarius TaxID=197179 RepID=UPI0029588906|nr:THO complex subunit 2 isoform X2 [Cylas formicarius]